MSITIKPKDVAIELDKRQHLPFVVESQCPRCARPHTSDLSYGGGRYGKYLSYPTIGEPEELHCYCEHCEHEWSITLVVEVTLKVMS